MVVSMHWGVHFLPGVIAMYQFEAGHAAIDAGANIIIGHHAHILKGIEIYKDKVIFYSLGNFNMDTPQDFMLGTRFHQLYRYEMDPEYPMFGYPMDSKKTVLVKCTIADKAIQRVACLPLWINRKGQPEPLSRSDSRSDEVYKYMQWACKDQRLDTRLGQEGDDIVVFPD